MKGRMKKMKKITALVLALMMACLMTCAFAAEADPLYEKLIEIVNNQ